MKQQENLEQSGATLVKQVEISLTTSVKCVNNQKSLKLSKDITEKKGMERRTTEIKWREEQQKSNGTLKDEEHNNRWLCFQCNQWGNFEFITIEETTNNVIAECPHCGQIRSKNSPAHPYKSQTGPRLSYANTCKRCGERDYFFFQVGQYNGIAGYCPTCEHPLYHKGTRKQPYGNTLKTSKETIKQSKLRKEREKLKDIRNFYIKI